MRPGGLAAVCNDVIINARRRIVELGSAVSTVLLVRLLTRRRPPGDWGLAAIEHDTRWVQRVTDEQEREGIGDHVMVLHAPLVPHGLAQEDLLWYDEAVLAAGSTPRWEVTSSTCWSWTAHLRMHRGMDGLARDPALPVLQHRLEPGATVVLADVEQPGEQEVVRRWERELGLSFRRLLEQAGVAVTTISGPISARRQS